MASNRDSRFIPSHCLRKYDIEMFPYLLTHNCDVRLERVLKNGNIRYYYFRLYDCGSNSNRTIQVEEKKVVVIKKRHNKNAGAEIDSKDNGVHTTSRILYLYEPTIDDDPEHIKEVITNMVDATVNRIVELITEYGFLFSYDSQYMLEYELYYEK